MAGIRNGIISDPITFKSSIVTVHSMLMASGSLGVCFMHDTLIFGWMCCGSLLWWCYGTGSCTLLGVESVSTSRRWLDIHWAKLRQQLLSLSKPSIVLT